MLVVKQCFLFGFKFRELVLACSLSLCLSVILESVIYIAMCEHNTLIIQYAFLLFIILGVDKKNAQQYRHFSDQLGWMFLSHSSSYHAYAYVFLNGRGKTRTDFTVFSRQIPASCFTVAATTEDGCKSAVHPYIMKHLQENTKEKNTESTERKYSFLNN